jgi:hypothetical protein
MTLSPALNPLHLTGGHLAAASRAIFLLVLKLK